MTKKFNPTYKLEDKIFIHTIKQDGIVESINRESESVVAKITNQKTRKLERIDVMIKNISPYREMNTTHSLKRDTLLFAKTKEDATVPSKHYEDAGYDLYSCFEEDEIIIKPNKVQLVPTGIASCVSPDYFLLARERGSTGTKCMSVRAGVIDASYRGEIFIPINNTGDKTIIITKKETVKKDDSVIYYPYKKAIAQLILIPVPNVEVKEISFDELKAIPSKRGSGALGSSGK